MNGRLGLGRFVKAGELSTVDKGPGIPKSLVAAVAVPGSAPKSQGPPLPQDTSQGPPTTIGEGKTTWKPPDWASDPRPGLFQLEVVKDGAVVDHILLDRKRALFGRQIVMCDYVLDHPSISRQHAAVVHHRNGSIYVIDLGSVHGTFVSNERLVKDTPVELEVGQSLRFAASTRSYILRRGLSQAAAVMSTLSKPSVTAAAQALPPLPLPDPNDEEAVVLYNTEMNRRGLPAAGSGEEELGKRKGSLSASEGGEQPSERQTKKQRKAKVTFPDQFGGHIQLVVGYSDGADVGDVGPTGVKEGFTLKGKYQSMITSTLIPKEVRAAPATQLGAGPSPSASLTPKLQQYLQRVRGVSEHSGDLYHDFLGAASGAAVGASWSNGGLAGTILPQESSVMEASGHEPQDEGQAGNLFWVEEHHVVQDSVVGGREGLEAQTGPMKKVAGVG